MRRWRKEEWNDVQYNRGEGGRTRKSIRERRKRVTKKRVMVKK